MTNTPPNSPPTPASRPNPFSSPPPPSSGGGSPLRPPPTPGSLFSRLGARATFDYMPIHDTLVMFDMHDVTPALYDLLKIAPPVKDDGSSDPTESKALIGMVEKDKALAAAMRTHLDQYWANFKILGAIHIYDWREEVKQAAINRLNATKQRPNFIRAIDPLLVMNILARSRAYLLIHGAALALDRPFLERVVMTDDPRILTLVTDGMHVVDSLVPPPPPDDIFDDLDEDDK